MTQVEIAKMIEEAARQEGIERCLWSDIEQNETEDSQPVYLLFGKGQFAAHEKFDAPKPRDNAEGFIKAVREGFRRANSRYAQIQ